MDGEDREGGFWRHLQLLRACRDALPTIVDGVELRLSHAQLDPEKWEPLTLLGDHPMSALEPSLILPWTRPDDIARLRSGKAVEVGVGDRLIVVDVQTNRGIAGSKGKLDHPHHRETRLVTLGVVRGDAAPVAVPGTWLFVGAGDVLTQILLNKLDDVREALIARFEEMVGEIDLADRITDFDRGTWRAKFDDLDRDTKFAARLLWEAEDDTPNNAAMAFGYMMGRAEARESRREQAKSASTVLRKTGDPARKLAIRIIETTPNIVLRRCAEQVGVELGKSPRTIENTIAPLFKTGADGVSRPDPEKVKVFRIKYEAEANDANP